MALTERFIAIATKTKSTAKKSSLIHQWLGFPCSQSVSIRIGNYIEEFINQSIKERNIKCVLDNNQTITIDNHIHQIDHLIQTDDGEIWHLEAKSNLDLDRGKKRDVVNRDLIITEALSSLIGVNVTSCIFCPFIDDSKQSPSLGYIMGMKEFISKFKPDFTLSEFKLLGSNPAIHSVL